MALSICHWGACAFIWLSGPSRRHLHLNRLQGVLGALLIRLNVGAAVYRQHSFLREHPILEVVGATAITGCISYLVRALFVVIGTTLITLLVRSCS